MSQNSLKREAKRLTGEYLKRFGAEPDATQREEARRTGELMALAGSLRASAIAGGVDLVELNKIEAMAREALERLPPAPANRVSRIEVELVRSRHEPGLDELEAENCALKARLAAFESGANPPNRPELPAGAFDGAASVQQPSAPVDSSTPTPESNPPQTLAQNLTEEQKRERMVCLRWQAGDRPQPMRDNVGGDRLYRDGVPGFGASRFDHPGWK